MPHHVVHKISHALNSVRRSVNGSKILILGVSYKADVDDIRESPALDIIGILQDMGAEILYHDPFVPELSLGDTTIDSLELTDEALRECDCAVLVTAHAQLDYARILEQSCLVVDTRNAWKGVSNPKLFRL